MAGIYWTSELKVIKLVSISSYLQHLASLNIKIFEYYTNIISSKKGTC